nr:PREDICTED: D(3) dopamine receptor-like [Latimeria chalumnae]|eukprot:XP_014350627.1 PREDICTED: D(3) dopamine receptor-like [Latimeria chalumnae]
MALFGLEEGSCVNITDEHQGQDNDTDCNALLRARNYYAMFYSILILAIVFGNVLVVMAVLREKALQTTTNYLVVSLAVADLLVAVLVMPWGVYLEVVGGNWTFGRVYCDIFVMMDVMMCTASILNLCAISIDRYTAVVLPMQYNSGRSSHRRIALMITAVWTLAFAVSCPLLFGFNTTEDLSVCSISNPNFVIYSSIMSFYLPFAVTLLVYIRIYMALRKRQKRITSRKSNRIVIPETCSQPQENGGRLSLNHLGSLPLHMKLKRKKKAGLPSKQNLLTQLDLQNYCSFSHASFTKSDMEIEEELERAGELPKVSSEVKRLSNGKTQTTVSHGLGRRGSQFRERKATQMLVIVLGVFLICWLPFFVTHILNTHCKRCHVPPELYSATTWLGYVNSALNPVIYTTFNTEFRKAFIKILRC